MKLTGNVIGFETAQDFLRFMTELSAADLIESDEALLDIELGDNLGYKVTVNNPEKFVMIKLIFAEQFD